MYRALFTDVYKLKCLLFSETKILEGDDRMTKRVTKPVYSEDFLLDLYTDMVRIREFEETAAEFFMKGLLSGNIHLGIGQEATATGACHALRKSDYVTSTHRGHGVAIAKGASTNRMMAELVGKATGYCKGKGGSMHIVDVSLGNLGANGIVGAGIPIATGSALASKIKGTDEVTVSIFGDGASNQGVFHESINMAAAWKLPIVYLCENNSYGISTSIHRITNTETIAVRAKAYNIPGVTIDGNDVLAVYEAVKKAVEYAREGKGPSLVECKTYRHQGHYCGDPANYRPKEYMEEAHEKDAIKRFKEYLLSNNISEEKLSKIEIESKEELTDAVKFAEESDWPNVEEAITDVYSSDNERSVLR